MKIILEKPGVGHSSPNWVPGEASVTADGEKCDMHFKNKQTMVSNSPQLLEA